MDRYRIIQKKNPTKKDIEEDKKDEFIKEKKLDYGFGYTNPPISREGILPVSGLILNSAPPTQPNSVVTKSYVDDRIENMNNRIEYLSTQHEDKYKNFFKLWMIIGVLVFVVGAVAFVFRNFKY